MIIIMFDGSTLHCDEIEFTGDGHIIADEYRIVPISYVLKIVSYPEC